MDAAEGSSLQIPITTSQKGVTTDYVDSTDEKHYFFIVRVIRGLKLFVETLRFAWDLELGI